MKIVHFYSPQSSSGKVMFLHLSVSHSVHRGVCLSQHALRQTTPWADISQHALGQTSPGQTYNSMYSGRSPLPDGHYSGWYASYWNAFLLKIKAWILQIKVYVKIFTFLPKLRELHFSFMISRNRKDICDRG